MICGALPFSLFSIGEYRQKNEHLLTMTDDRIKNILGVITKVPALILSELQTEFNRARIFFCRLPLPEGIRLRVSSFKERE